MSASIRQILQRLSPVLVTINKSDLFTFGSTTIRPPTVSSKVTKTATATATATVAATTLSSTPSPSSPITTGNTSSQQQQPSSSSLSSSPPDSDSTSDPEYTTTPWSSLIPESHLSPLSDPSTTSALFTSKRVIFFGEQHHQPAVLKAQLSCLDLLHRHVTERGGKVVVVMEMFNIKQDADLERWTNAEWSQESSDLLTSSSTPISQNDPPSSSSTTATTSVPTTPSSHPISDSINDNDTLLLTRYASSTEGFHLPHYLPLLHLSRSLSIPLHGGFPPREWARVVHREGLTALRSHPVYADQIPVEFTTRWNDVSDIGEAHLAHMRGLMRGTPAVYPPVGDSSGDGDGVVVFEQDGETRTGKRKFERGIPPAQTLKDTFFAWSIDRLLRADEKVVVFAVCGAGHCEFGFGAVERLRACSGEEVTVVVSKGWDGEEFRRKREDGVGGMDRDGMIEGGTGGGDGDSERRIADCVVPYVVEYGRWEE